MNKDIIIIFIINDNNNKSNNNNNNNNIICKACTHKNALALYKPALQTFLLHHRMFSLYTLQLLLIDENLQTT